MQSLSVIDAIWKFDTKSLNEPLCASDNLTGCSWIFDGYSLLFDEAIFRKIFSALISLFLERNQRTDSGTNLIK